jgi:hypothetical protein
MWKDVVDKPCLVVSFWVFDFECASDCLSFGL